MIGKNTVPWSMAARALSNLGNILNRSFQKPTGSVTKLINNLSRAIKMRIRKIHWPCSGATTYLIQIIKAHESLGRTMSMSTTILFLTSIPLKIRVAKSDKKKKKGMKTMPVTLCNKCRRHRLICPAWSLVLVVTRS